MKHKWHLTTWAALVVAAAYLTPVAHAAEDLQGEAQQTKASFLKTDAGMQKFFDTSAGYAIFPNVGKGGFIVGGAHGNGLVYEKAKPIGQASMTQASIGAQAGGQNFSEVIFFENQAALDNFKASKFEMSAEMSAVAAAQGASAAAKYNQGIAVFTLPKKGLMVQASVGGQRFKFTPFATSSEGVGAPGKDSSQEKK